MVIINMLIFYDVDKDGHAIKKTTANEALFSLALVILQQCLLQVVSVFGVAVTNLPSMATE